MTPENGIENLPALESDPLAPVNPEPKAEEKPPQPDPFQTEVRSAFMQIGSALQQIVARQDETEGKLAPKEEPKPEAWTPTSWDDFPKVAEEKAREAARQVIEEEKAQYKQVEDERQARDQQLETYLNQQESELVKAGRLPEVVDINNPEDPGRKARAELFGLAAHLGSTDIKGVDSYRKAMNESGITYDPRVKQFVRSNPPMPGADVPVRSSSNRTSVTTGNRPSPQEIRKGDFDFLVEKYGKNYGF